MKANVSISIIFALFLFVTGNVFANTGSDAFLYHSVKKYDNVVSTSYFKGNGSSQNLIPFKKKVNTFDEHGACISKVTYVFDMDSKSWKLSSKMVYTYTDGKLTTLEHFEWNEKENIWDESQKTLYTQAEDGTTVIVK